MDSTLALLKGMLQMANTIEEANETLEKFGYMTLDEKMALLKSIFNMKLVSKKSVDMPIEKQKQSEYHAMLMAVLND